MDRCALFVDAAYVLSDGAMAVHGTRHRDSVSWDYAGLLKLVAGLSRDRTGLPVLRCYWYETTPDSRRTAEHETLAELPGLKLRMGRVRPGRRDGVETEIHRDLTTLARNGAVSDAVIVSAEEDLVQVVAEAQDLGVRVILLQVTSEGSWGAARLLRQESDDIIEITRDQLGPHVELISGAEPARSDVQPDYQRLVAAAQAARPALTAPALPVASGHAAAGPAGALLSPAAGLAAPQPAGSQAATAQQVVQQPHAPSSPAPQPVPQHPVAQHPADQQPALQPMAQAAAAQPAAAMPPDAVQARPLSADYRAASPDYLQPGRASSAAPLPGGAGPAGGPPGSQPGDSAAASSLQAAARSAGQQLSAQAGQRSADVPVLNGFAAYPADQLAPGQAAGQHSQASPGMAGNGSGQAAPGQSGFAQSGFVPGGYQSGGQPEYAAGQNGHGTSQQRGLPGGGLPDSGAGQNGHGAGPRSADLSGGLAPGGVGPHAQPQRGPGQQDPLQPGAAQRGVAQYGAGQYGADQYGAGQHGAGQHGASQHGPAQLDASQHRNGQHGNGQHNNGLHGAGERGASQPGSLPQGLPSDARGMGNPPQHAMGQLPQSQNSHTQNGYQSNGYQQNGLSRGPLPPSQPPPASQPLSGQPDDGLLPGGYPPDARYQPGAYRQNGTPPGGAASRPGGHRQADPLAPGPLGSAQPYQQPAAPGFGAGGLTGGSLGPPAQHGGGQPGGYRPAIEGHYGAPAPVAGPRPSGQLPVPGQPGLAAPQFSLAEAVQAAHIEGLGFGEAVARDAPALWLEAVLARKPRMPSDLETRLLQGSALPIDALLHDEVRHALRRGFWDALERR
ncbi:MAG TPA: NYN domain-containing protein [Streptosporangiaceae bacterium]